jgi:hypothetical protein
VSTLENAGAIPIFVKNALTVEALVDGRWRGVSERVLPITLDGYPNVPACLTLEPGQKLAATDGWLGDACFGIDPCHANAHVAAGTHRIVASACDGAHVFAGNSFVWAPP